MIIVFTVNPSEYPKHREWNAKVFSMPKIPRGDLGQCAIIRAILRAITEKVPYSTKMKFSGSTSNSTLENLCTWLRPIGVIYKEDRVWKISNEGRKLLESEDDLYLMAIFCANIRFMAELLVQLESPLTTNELLNIANKDYKLNWDTKSEVGNRLTWFRQLNLVSFNDFKNTYYLTEEGKKFLENSSYVNPEDIEVIGDKTINEVGVPVSSWAVNLIQMELEELIIRKPSVGYIPGSISEMCETFDGFIQLMYSNVNRETFLKYSQETYNIAISSANAFATTMTNLNFLERTSRDTYQATSLAKNWLINKSPVDLVYCLHVKVLFIFELLKELERESLTFKELAVIAKVSYGFETERIDEIRKRINIMQLALLVQEETPGKYGLTQRGKNVLGEVVIQESGDLPQVNELTKKVVSIEDDLTVNDYLTELRLSSKESSNPIRFEKAIASALSILGFNVIRHGGPGKTDVLIQSPSIPKYSFSVTVDAKSTQSGSVTEGLINFDTLKDHRKIHGADFMAVIGFSFQGERLIKRAIEHEVALIDIEDLETLIRLHNEIPLLVNSYKKIFSQKGKVNVSVLEKDRREIQRSGILLQAVMECLIEESLDPVTEGLLHDKDIYRTLRSYEKFDSPPLLGEISEMLQFLSSPLIGSIGRSREGYYALGTLADAMNKFNFYAKSCSVN